MKCKAPAYDLKKHFNCIDSCKHISEGKKKENQKMISITQACKLKRATHSSEFKNLLLVLRSFDLNS